MAAVLFGQCNSQEFSENQHDDRKKKMVSSQIKARGITDQKVLDAMLNVDRHLFVPEEFASQAYADHPLPIGEGQTISQPYIVALMTHILDLNRSTKVLEIGTGSGYQAAVLAEICDSVFTIEIFESLGLKAKKLLSDLGYTNISVKIGNGYQGWDRHAPFDAIIVTCAPTHIPDPLKQQLAENGKIIIPVGAYHSQELILLEKVNGKLKQKEITGVRFVPMIDDEGNKY